MDLNNKNLLQSKFIILHFSEYCYETPKEIRININNIVAYFKQKDNNNKTKLILKNFKCIVEEAPEKIDSLIWENEYKNY